MGNELDKVALKGDNAAVYRLLSTGANPNYKDKDGCPVLFAVWPKKVIFLWLKHYYRKVQIYMLQITMEQVHYLSQVRKVIIKLYKL